MANGWNLWVWLECIGVVSGCCCKEVYRYPQVIIIITFPYSTCISSFFGSSISTSLFIFKMFFRSLRIKGAACSAQGLESPIIFRKETPQLCITRGNPDHPHSVCVCMCVCVCVCVCACVCVCVCVCEAERWFKIFMTATHTDSICCQGNTPQRLGVVFWYVSSWPLEMSSV